MTLLIAGASFKKPSVLPGFAPTLGFALVYLSVIVLLPLAALIAKASGLGFGGLWTVATQPRVLAALKTTFGLSLAAALVDVVFGAIVAWTLTRYRFPGRRPVDALVDLPFALPTAVAGDPEFKKDVDYYPNQSDNFFVGNSFPTCGINFSAQEIMKQTKD